jgi:hypothetical protein
MIFSSGIKEEGDSHWSGLSKPVFIVLAKEIASFGRF